MRSDAKRPTAGSNQRRTTGLGRVFRRASATRGASRAGGSGAPSQCTRTGALALTLAALILLGFASIAKAKTVVDGFGTSGAAGCCTFAPPLGTKGGEITSNPGSSPIGHQPLGAAVNNSGTGAPAGTSYVVDNRGNRVQRFDPSGEFDLTWGQNVFGRDEMQLLDFKRGPGFAATPNTPLGTITLTFKGQTTAPLPVATNNGGFELSSPSSTEVKNALEALPAIGAGEVEVFGPNCCPKVVRFVGALGGANQPQLVVDNSGLEGSEFSIVPSTLEHGAGEDTFSGAEVCTEAELCKEGQTVGTTENGGQLRDPRGVAVNQSNGHVYVTEQGNRRVSEFDADGEFVRAWGWDVVMTGGTGDVSENAFEICTVASECKQAASNGDDGGRFSSQIGYPATDPSGNVWIPDAANERLQKFDSEGNFIAAYGWDVDAEGGSGELEECTSTALNACKAATNGSDLGKFSANSPQQIAFDDLGNLYALDAGSNDRVQRFDPAFTEATEFGATALEGFTTQAPEAIAATEGGEGLAFVIEDDLEGGNTFQNERQIVELDPSDESLTDTSLVGAGLTGNEAIPGLAANDTTGDLLAAVASLSPRHVLVLSEAPLAPLALVMEPVTEQTDDSVTFSASIDPQGGLPLVGCRFEYSLDQNNWTEVPEADCAMLDPEGGTQALEEVVTGLEPNTRYFVRFQASRPLVAGSTEVTSVKSFDTIAPPPVITDVGVVQVADRSARLVGTIDPRNTATGYVFEYGTSPALGSTTSPLDIGSGSTPITVSRVVSGLKPDTDYYFRLVATNLTATTTSASETFHTRATPPPPVSPGNCSNQQRRSEQGTTHLPDCRAYEMVSPPDKNQGSVDQFFWGRYEASFARDGEAAAFCTNALFGEPAGQSETLCSEYVSRRTPSGWQTTNPFPRHCLNDRDDLLNARATGYLNPYLDKAINYVPESSDCPIPLIDPGAPDSARNLYRQDLATDQYELIAPTPIAANGVFGAAGNMPFVGGSEDLTSFAYESETNQTPPPDSPAPDSFIKIYEWEQQGHGACATPGGCLGLVSKDPSGTPFTTDSSKAAGGGAGTIVGIPAIALPNDVSSDGERIYFHNSAGVDQHLYMREGGTVTLDVSASECTVECGPDLSADVFLWASPEGDVAIFASCDRLTDESAASKVCGASGFSSGDGAKLYRWDRDAPPGNRLTDLTVDEEPADGLQPNALGIVGGRAGAGGDVVYFVTGGSGASSGGQIVADGPAGAGMRLFRWRWNGGSPTVDYLAPYESVGQGDPVGDQIPDVNANSLRSDPNAYAVGGIRVTADGEHLLITTRLKLDPAGDRDSDLDAYRWSEADGWLCVSCQLPGAPSAGDVNTVYPSNGDGVVDRREPYYNITDDGQGIFFSARDALVPVDVNGEAGCPLVKVSNSTGATWSCQDVYEWNDGTLSLVTSGSGENPFVMLGATGDGKSLFFITRERLVGHDTDNGTDIYVARTGGGFPEPKAQPPECEGEGCREGGTDAPEVAGAGTAVFQGAGNPKAKQQTDNRCPANRLRRGKRCMPLRAIARKRCRRLNGQAKRRCVNKQTRRLRRAQRRRAQRRAKRIQRRTNAQHRANFDRRATR